MTTTSPANLASQFHANAKALDAQFHAAADVLDGIATISTAQALERLQRSAEAACQRIGNARQRVSDLASGVLASLAGAVTALARDFALPAVETTSLPPTCAATPTAPDIESNAPHPAGRQQFAAEIARVASLPPRQPSPDVQTLTLPQAVGMGLFDQDEAEALRKRAEQERPAGKDEQTAQPADSDASSTAPTTDSNHVEPVEPVVAQTAANSTVEPADRADEAPSNPATATSLPWQASAPTAPTPGRTKQPRGRKGSGRKGRGRKSKRT
jgi:hypothetical protein